MVNTLHLSVRSDISDNFRNTSTSNHSSPVCELILSKDGQFSEARNHYVYFTEQLENIRDGFSPSVHANVDRDKFLIVRGSDRRHGVGACESDSV